MCLGGDVEAVVDLYLVETISTANIIKKVESIRLEGGNLLD